MNYTLDLRAVNSMAELHDLLKDTFAFPSYYGRNFDALHDCLGDLDRTPMTITFVGYCDACRRIGWRMNILLQLLADFRAEREGSVAIVIAKK